MSYLCGKQKRKDGPGRPFFVSDRPLRRKNIAATVKNDAAMVSEEGPTAEKIRPTRTVGRIFGARKFLRMLKMLMSAAAQPFTLIDVPSKVTV